MVMKKTKDRIKDQDYITIMIVILTTIIMEAAGITPSIVCYSRVHQDE